MIRYKPLPFVEALRRLQIENHNQAVVGQQVPVTMEEVRRAELVQTMESQGFQLIAEALRTVELNAFTALRSGASNPDRQLGRLECIEEMRRTLSAMLGVSDRAQLDMIAGEASEDWSLDIGEEA